MDPIIYTIFQKRPLSIPDFFFLSKKRTKPRKDNGNNKTLCQHFTCIFRWKCGHVLYSLHAESNYCSWEAFSQVESLLISGGPFFNFGKAQPSFGATSNLCLLSPTYEATSLNILSRFQIWMVIICPILFGMIRNIVNKLKYLQMHFWKQQIFSRTCSIPLFDPHKHYWLWSCTYQNFEISRMEVPK